MDDSWVRTSLRIECELGNAGEGVEGWFVGGVDLLLDLEEGIFLVG